jgi:hypothetical protein
MFQLLSKTANLASKYCEEETDRGQGSGKEKWEEKYPTGWTNLGKNKGRIAKQKRPRNGNKFKKRKEVDG